MDAAEVVGHLFLGEVDRRGDDVARVLVAELDDVFAEVRLHGGDAVRLEWELRPISSVTIDLPLVTVRAPAAWQMPRMMSLAAAASGAQWTFAPASVAFFS